MPTADEHEGAEVAGRLVRGDVLACSMVRGVEACVVRGADRGLMQHDVALAAMAHMGKAGCKTYQDCSLAAGVGFSVFFTQKIVVCVRLYFNNVLGGRGVILVARTLERFLTSLLLSAIPPSLSSFCQVRDRRVRFGPRSELSAWAWQVRIHSHRRAHRRAGCRCSARQVDRSSALVAAIVVAAIVVLAIVTAIVIAALIAAVVVPAIVAVIVVPAIVAVIVVPALIAATVAVIAAVVVVGVAAVVTAIVAPVERAGGCKVESGVAGRRGGAEGGAEGSAEGAQRGRPSRQRRRSKSRLARSGRRQEERRAQRRTARHVGDCVGRSGRRCGRRTGGAGSGCAGGGWGCAAVACGWWRRSAVRAGRKRGRRAAAMRGEQRPRAWVVAPWGARAAASAALSQRDSAGWPWPYYEGKEHFKRAGPPLSHARTAPDAGGLEGDRLLHLLQHSVAVARATDDVHCTRRAPEGVSLSRGCAA